MKVFAFFFHRWSQYFSPFMRVLWFISAVIWSFNWNGVLLIDKLCNHVFSKDQLSEKFRSIGQNSCLFELKVSIETKKKRKKWQIFFTHVFSFAGFFCRRTKASADASTSICMSVYRLFRCSFFYFGEVEKIRFQSLHVSFLCIEANFRRFFMCQNFCIDN